MIRPSGEIYVAIRKSKEMDFVQHVSSPASSFDPATNRVQQALDHIAAELR